MRLLDHAIDAALPDPFREAAVRARLVPFLCGAVCITQSVHQVEHAGHLAEVFAMNRPVDTRAIRHECLTRGGRRALLPRREFQMPAERFARLGAGDHLAMQQFGCVRPGRFPGA